MYLIVSKISYLTFYLSLLLSLLLLGVCTTIFVLAGGPPPSVTFDLSGNILFGVSILQIIILLFCLIILKKKVKDCGFLFFCELGLLMSVAGHCYLLYNFQNFQLDPQKMFDYTTSYMEDNNGPPPFLDFVQNNVPCCGTTSFRNYAVTQQRNFTVPQSCCKNSEPASTTASTVENLIHQKEEEERLSCTGQNLDLFYYTMIEEMEKEAFDKFVQDSEEVDEVELTRSDNNPFQALLTSSSSSSFQVFTFNYNQNAVRDKWMTPEFRKIMKTKFGPLYEQSVRTEHGEELLQMTLDITNRSSSSNYTKCEINDIVDMAVIKFAEEQFNKTYDMIIKVFTTGVIGSDDFKNSVQINVLGCHQFLEQVDLLQSIMIGRWKHLAWINRYMPLGPLFQNWKIIFYYFLIILISLNTLVFLLFNFMRARNHCCSNNQDHYLTTSFDLPD